VTQLGLGACLADDMGLGKTMQVIALLLHLRSAEKTKDVAHQASLLVAPASLLGNWRAELTRFAPTLRAKILHSSEMDEDEVSAIGTDPAGQLAETDLVITTYGMLHRTPWLMEAKWRLAMLDEAQAIKNASTRQSQMTRKLQASARVALTGTPVENRLGDLWSLFDFLNPGLLGSAKTFASYTKKLASAQTPDYAPLRSLIGPYILRRLKTDKTIIADLPEKTEMKAYCPLGKRQAVLYQQAVEDLANQIATAAGIARKGLILATLLKLKQICNHPSQWLGDGEYAPGESGKFERLRELCEELASRQQKVLLFTQFREITAPLAEYLQRVFGRPGLVLHGQVAVGQRKKLVDEFQREDGPPFFVLSIKAGGTGLNLTAASTVIHFDRWWNPAVENQATDRAFRIGQKQNVLVHKFICRGTVEEKIDRMIEEKVGLAKGVLDAGGETMLTEMDDKQLLELLSLDLKRARATEG
jgi:non-specific serine/threonine protein kinase